MSASFSLAEFLRLLETYNLALWPLQLVAYILAIAALAAVARRTTHSGKVVAAVLSLYWLWTGGVFCLLYWSRQTALAYVLGAACLIQGGFFLRAGLRGTLSFRLRADLYSLVGMVLIGYAMVGYYAAGLPLGHAYPRSLPLGLVPCPTTIFTFGMLLFSEQRVPRHLLAVPVLWTVLGIGAVSIGILEDIGLIISGVLGTVMILARPEPSG